MFHVDLVELDREGSLEVRETAPTDHALWSDTDLSLGEGVTVQLTVTGSSTGQVIARGVVRTSLTRQCRRCLAPLAPTVEAQVEMVWAVVDELAPEAAREDEVRPLDPRGDRLDMGPAIREELILAAPLWVLCREDCRGLCPHCGTNWNVEECSCSPGEPDPRWDVLRTIKFESG